MSSVSVDPAVVTVHVATPRSDLAEKSQLQSSTRWVGVQSLSVQASTRLAELSEDIGVGVGAGVGVVVSARRDEPSHAPRGVAVKSDAGSRLTGSRA